MLKSRFKGITMKKPIKILVISDGEVTVYNLITTGRQSEAKDWVIRHIDRELDSSDSPFIDSQTETINNLG